jgi:hypothetical protein
MSPLRYAFLGIPLLGLAELAAHVWFAKRPPSFDEWSTVVGAVRETRHEGDLLVVSPAWADPAARRALGDALMPLRDDARPDVTRYAHALELSILGEHAPELEGWREESRRTSGKFLLRRVENPAPANVVYDFVDHARPPFADVRNTQPPTACTWNPHAPFAASGSFGHPSFAPERFECSGHDGSGAFFNVGATVIADQEFRPRRCLWSPPSARGEIVTRFHDVPLGRVIRGHGGMYWIVEREKKGAPVTLSVRVDGDTVGRAVHHDGDGWALFQFDLGAHAGAAKAEVEIGVSSPGNGNRPFCFEADTR